MNERHICPKTEGIVEIPLSPAEKELLKQFAVTPFLPVASNGQFPVCNEFSIETHEAGSLLQKLEKRGLIRIDYDIPLIGYDYSIYNEYSLCGSMALTGLGQDMLDDLEFEG